MNNKIPPPLWMILTGVIMWLVARSPWGFSTEIPYTSEFGTAIGLLGAVVIVLGIAQFAKLQTTVNPLDLSKSTKLATQGIYRFTRNPMYLGLALILLGWGLRLGSPTNVLCVAAFVVVMNQWQIKPEEAALRSLFGDAYAEYCHRVRRWL